MRVSVVICGYTMDRLEVFTAAIDSVLAQTHRPLEVVIVIDGNPTLYGEIVRLYGDDPTVRIDLNDENRGISYSRTRGAELATGEVVAFIDDDAVAEPRWVARLVELYESTDAVAAGGNVEPAWVDSRPWWFPDEFYWLVGVTEPGFAEDGQEVRNVYGCNISYRRDAFLEVGGYDTKTGRKGNRHLQAHEAPVGIRLLQTFGRGMIFVEDAIVTHTLFTYRGRAKWLLRRAFWQGYSKRVMHRLYPDAPGTEQAYLRMIVMQAIPSRIRSLRAADRIRMLGQLVMLVGLTTMVGLGYAVATMTPGLIDRVNQ